MARCLPKLPAIVDPHMDALRHDPGHFVLERRVLGETWRQCDEVLHMLIGVDGDRIFMESLALNNLGADLWG